MPIPSNSPLILPVILCQGGCRSKMRIEVVYGMKGVITSMTAYCDTCKYGREVSNMYVTGQDTKWVEAKVAPPTPQPPAVPATPAPAKSHGSPLPSGAVRVESEEAPNPDVVGAVPTQPESTAGLTGA